MYKRQDTVSIPGVRNIVQMLGAVPLADTIDGTRQFLACLLYTSLVIALLSDGKGTGHQIVEANFTVSVGGNGLIDALAGDGEGNACLLYTSRCV